MVENIIKYIYFDMDGVLIDAKEWHYDALNQALKDCNYLPIDRAEHLAIYDGLSTSQKLEKLYSKNRVDRQDFSKIEKLKQEYTWKMGCDKIIPSKIHIEALSKLKKEGHRIAVCSNSIKKTVELFLQKADLMVYVDLILSNECVKRKKPYPDIYLEAMNRFNAKPYECLILEDNFNGIKAAEASGAHLLKIYEISDTNYENIRKKIKEVRKK